jgi:hypothetical protein
MSKKNRLHNGQEQFDYRKFAVDDMDISRKKRLGLYRRRRTKSPLRPVWKKYWKNDPAPESGTPRHERGLNSQR